MTAPNPVNASVITLQMRTANGSAQESLIDKDKLIESLQSQITEFLLSGADLITREKDPAKKLEEFALSLVNVVFSPAITESCQVAAAKRQISIWCSPDMKFAPGCCLQASQRQAIDATYRFVEENLLGNLMQEATRLATLKEKNQGINFREREETLRGDMRRAAILVWEFLTTFSGDVRPLFDVARRLNENEFSNWDFAIDRLIHGFHSAGTPANVVDTFHLGSIGGSTVYKDSVGFQRFLNQRFEAIGADLVRLKDSLKD